MEIKNLEKTIEELKNVSKKRNFKQSIDLIVTLKGLDLKKPEHKLKFEIPIAVPFSDPKIGVFADTLIPKVKPLESQNVLLIRKDEIESYSKNKRLAKKTARECKSFLAEATLMPLVGKFLGPILAPRNKMPKPIPQTIPDILPIVKREKATIKVALKDSPVIQCAVGREDMATEDLAKNVKTVLDSIESVLPAGKANINKIYIKTTMGGKPLRLII